MKFITRTKYLGYYFSKLNWKQLTSFITHVQAIKGYSKGYIWWDVVRSVYQFNVGIMDYFIFRFYDLDMDERAKWVGTGFKYEFDLKMNPLKTRDVLENKIKFYEVYKPFIKHAYCSLEDLMDDTENARQVLGNPTGKMVVKDATGQCGFEVAILLVKDYPRERLIALMEKKGFNLAESFVQQHSKVQALSPSGLNTIRFITMINAKGTVDILGARLRISVNSHVDNLASGNIAAPIDLKTGKVNGPAVYSDITKKSVDNHPVTGVPIIGFEIPFWNEVMKQSEEIALFQPQNRGVGWDVAVTESGPDFIEGNHNWCKILWQLPENKGMKSVLQNYLD